MSVNVTQKIKNAFIVHSHVDEVWVLGEDFYIHEPKDPKAFTHIKREDVDLSDAPTQEERKVSDEDKATISKINESTTAEEVQALSPVGVSEAVHEAAKNKIESFKSEKVETGSSEVVLNEGSEAGSEASEGSEVVNEENDQKQQSGGGRGGRGGGKR